MTQQMEMPVTEESAGQETAAPSQPDATPGILSKAATIPGRGPDSEDRLGLIQVRACVELGSAELLVREIASLVPGSVVQLDRLVGEPADLTINGLVVARGDVVVVDDHLGLRIGELVGSDEGREP